MTSVGPSATEIMALLQIGHETRAFEVKGPGLSSDKHHLARVARACLGMGNLRDGGWVVIGIDDKDLPSMLPGLAADEVQSWAEFDDVAKRLNAYADPPLKFEIHHLVLPGGAQVMVVEVFEFDELPHLCNKEYMGVLRDGALYVRTARSPATTEVADSVHMRQVLDLATAKSLRRYLRTARDAGGVVGLSEVAAKSDDLFEAQRNEAWRG